MATARHGLYGSFCKRPLDCVLALFAMVVLLPVLLLVGGLVRWQLGSPVLFKQKRPGLNEKIFTLYKFRTMTSDKDEQGELLPDRIRLTKFGKLLRSTSLDELPELLNILKGDMSFIGPRPLLVKYLNYYTDYERKRHEVRPGLTGLAQVRGRNLLYWEERFKLDVHYVQHISFILDAKIFFLTIIKVMSKSDIAVGSEHIFQDLDVERGEGFDKSVELFRDKSVQR